jgi:SAM-dependent methyltransferase
MAALHRVRPATAEDVGFLGDVSLAVATLPADFDEVEWRAGFSDWTLETLADTAVVELDGNRVGRLRIRRTPESIELCGIQLLPEVQNRGIGTAIIRGLQAEAATAAVPLELGVEKDNADARRLYDRLGFAKIGESDTEHKLQWLDRKAAVAMDNLWDADTARRYDTPGTGMFAPEVLGPTVDRLASLTGDGRALEFAIGTGRVAVPLAERVPVTGVELSTAMVEQLRTKVDEETIPVFIGDMATTRVPGEFTLVYLVFNTISNLLTQAEQVECFHNAARHLSPGGRFVIELWVPELRRLPPGLPATVGITDPGYILLDTYDVLHQHVVSHHFRFEEDGGTEAHLARTPHRYIWPAELDLMAQLAGFTLESRHADWTGTEFTATSPSHVSTYHLTT